MEFQKGQVVVLVRGADMPPELWDTYGNQPLLFRRYQQEDRPGATRWCKLMKMDGTLIDSPFLAKDGNGDPNMVEVFPAQNGD